MDGAVGPTMSCCEMGETLMRILVRLAMRSSKIYHPFNESIWAGISHSIVSLAILADSASVVKYLLGHGANPNDNYYLDESPLEWARTKKPPQTQRLFSYFLTMARRSNTVDTVVCYH